MTEFRGNYVFQSVDVQGPVESESVSTEWLSDTQRFIENDEDAQTIIENGTPGDWFVVEPGTYEITPPFDIPDKIAIEGRGGRLGNPQVVFKKVGDGDLATFQNGLWMVGIEFDANKQNGYTGNGLVARANSNKENWWQHCRVHSAAGDNVVFDGLHFSVFDWCRFDLADGWNIRYTHTAGVENGQNQYRGITQISKGGSGGVFYDDATHNAERFTDVLMASNSGPAFHGKGSGVYKYINGNIEVNDGPVFLFDEYSDGSRAEYRGFEFHLRGIQNNEAPGSSVNSASSRDVGSFHVQATAEVDNLELHGSYNSGASDAALFSDYSGGYVVDATIDAEVRNANLARIQNRTRLSVENIGERDTTTLLNAGSGGEVVAHLRDSIIDLARDTQRFTGIRSAAPSVSASTAVYLDDGTNTSTGGPELRYTTDGGTNWADMY